MKRWHVLTFITVLVVAALARNNALASDNPSLRGQVEGCPVGYICVTPEEYELHWDVCPIDPNFTPTVTDTPNGNGGSTPTPEVTPTPTDDPTKEPRERCDQGVGNGKDCTPGQSDNTVRPDHPQDPNDELDRNVPGNPERKNNSKGGGKK